ncbi:hypothetical protein ES319_A08G237900v1 [Gossypium barbadense]|uniref:Receptor-like serine/threonine-protein kinase n=2 Tax=Gossypium TaxID=3633 RepID=A0A5J5UVV0_GOSBA|nr:hypothetical protein ES319_A08G237900v1 [Gossypium barbadense]TYH07797.1 hypothetical protein ES288_A08G263000v1 [Gossypium darwinii]
MSGSNLSLLLHLYYCLCCLSFGNAFDTITLSTPINDSQALVSNNGVFRLGFFSLSSSTDHRYVGIWYNNRGVLEESVIWIANRNKPLKDDSGVFMVSDDGNLVVSDGQNQTLWSSNVRNPRGVDVSAQILDTGNLVLKANGNTVWESFWEPLNVFVPMMRLSTNVRTGEKVELTSWKSSSDPSTGSFTSGLQPLAIPQNFVWNNTKPYWRSGPWNGHSFTGIPNMNSFVLNGLSLVNDNQGIFYLTLAFFNSSYLSYVYLDPQGITRQRFWDDEKGNWTTYDSPAETECALYGTCGAFGICNSQKPSICSCMKGFKPNNIDEWNSGNWTNGCTRINPLRCHRVNNTDSEPDDNEYGFLKLERIKVPDVAEWSEYLENECKNRCLNNCSCIAYAFDAGIGCMSWSKDLIDIQEFSYGGIDLYIRLPRSELDKKNITVAIIITVVIGTTIIIVVSLIFLLRWMNKDRDRTGRRVYVKFEELAMFEDNGKETKLHQLPLFKFEELATATIDFNPSNKLGQGGFGPVYRGKLLDGKEIAVKRLSSVSGQGFEEFANEVLVISKLQHRNLVRLLGCCIEREEKMLVYEYMPNKSLDAFLFDSTKRKLLDWKNRFNIIKGISRGLLYLHQDSRLRIIHRDLKASNILLDEEMNPKISDFGMARIFGGNENQANTRRIVGTYGYMAPEYVFRGHFSEKSDVFSYGVLLLEIISGRRNTSFYNNEHFFSLLGYAWKLWIEDNILALADTELVSKQCCHQELLRCIHVGLLCVQEQANNRPSMSMVISMLNSEITDLLSPTQPAFTAAFYGESLPNNKWSINDVTITNTEGR